jgi:hypothetical protein
MRAVRVMCHCLYLFSVHIWFFGGVHVAHLFFCFVFFVCFPIMCLLRSESHAVMSAKMFAYKEVNVRCYPQLFVERGHVLFTLFRFVCA